MRHSRARRFTWPFFWTVNHDGAEGRTQMRYCHSLRPAIYPSSSPLSSSNKTYFRPNRQFQTDSTSKKARPRRSVLPCSSLPAMAIEASKNNASVRKNVERVTIPCPSCIRVLNLSCVMRSIVDPCGKTLDAKSSVTAIALNHATPAGRFPWILLRR